MNSYECSDNFEANFLPLISAKTAKFKSLKICMSAIIDAYNILV